MKKQNKQKPPSRRKPLKKQRTSEPSQTTKLQAAFKQTAAGVEEELEPPAKPIKRVSKGADEEME